MSIEYYTYFKYKMGKENYKNFDIADPHTVAVMVDDGVQGCMKNKIRKK